MEPWTIDTPTLRIRTFVVGPYENNVYVVADPTTQAAVIIDAADEAGVILEQVADVTPVAILTTHGHHDHVGAAPAVSEALGIPVHLHPADSELAGIDIDVPFATTAISVGSLRMETLHTPGHTPGSTCFLVGSVLLSGDTLFPGGPGATRFPYSSFAQIIESISRSLFTLPDETSVFPGHGRATTIATERPELGNWEARGW